MIPAKGKQGRSLNSIQSLSFHFRDRRIIRIIAISALAKQTQTRKNREYTRRSLLSLSLSKARFALEALATLSYFSTGESSPSLLS